MPIFEPLPVNDKGEDVCLRVPEESINPELKRLDFDMNEVKIANFFNYLRVS